MSLTLFLAATLSVAHADDALRARVVDLLGGVEYAPTAADWAALGNGAAAELLAIARDSAATPTQRGNALVALGYFPSADTTAHLGAVVRDATAESLLRRKACLGLARAAGAAATADLALALESDDVQLRAYAARALGTLGSDGRPALESRLARESSSTVLDAIHQALGK